MRAQRVLIGVLLALCVSCGGGSSPTGPPATPTPPAPTPTPTPTPPEPGFALVRAARIDWPATDATPQVGFEFTVPGPGDVLVELVDAVVIAQTTTTHVTLSLHTEEFLGGRPQCVQFLTRCTGIAEDEVIVQPGDPVRRLATTTTVTTAGPYFVMIGNWGPTGTVQGNLKAWFRAKAP